MASPLLARAPPAASIMACRSSIDCLSASRTLSASPLATGSARRHQSTSTDAPNAASPNAFVAAREQSLASLSTRIFNPKLLRSSHPVGYARNRTDPSSGPGRPENIAYFTANAKYYNLVIALNEAIRRNGLDFRDKSVYEKAALPSWMNANIMSEVHDMNLENGRYEEIVHKLNMLFAIRKQDSELTDAFFAPYVRPGAVLAVERQRKAKTVDNRGFAHARGSRKTAKASVQTIEGDGVIMVNGMPASDYFGNFISYLEDMIDPLLMTGKVSKYNVWATVKGGGLSGQAQAIKLGIARCLVIHEPQLQAMLDQAGLLTPDTRQVERKKTGQPGARKKFPWVKR